MNLLFTSAGRRNYLLSYFRAALNGTGSIMAADMSPHAPALAEADEAVIVPPVYDPSYVDSLKEVVERRQVHAIIPLNDLELPILSARARDFEALGARVLVSAPGIIDIAFDKWKTAQFITGLGLRAPKCYLTLSDALRAVELGHLQFPLVIKPRWGSASIGIEFPENRNELELAYKLLGIRLKRTILARASASESDRSILIQEKISGNEFGMDILNDLSGNHTGSFARKKLQMRAGETDRAVSVIDPRLSEIGQTIGSRLGHIGNLDCDVLESGNEYFVLEMNPRFGGGYPFSHEAGANIPGIYLEWLQGRGDIARFMRYRAGVLHSKCDRMVGFKTTNVEGSSFSTEIRKGTEQSIRGLDHVLLKQHLTDGSQENSEIE